MESIILMFSKILSKFGKLGKQFSCVEMISETWKIKFGNENRIGCTVMACLVWMDKLGIIFKG